MERDFSRGGAQVRENLTEAFGTFFLVLAIGLSGDPYAVGITAGALVYGGMSVSGAHFNPAVSMAMWLRGRLTGKRFSIYFVFQVAGALAGSFTAFWFTGRTFGPAPAPTVGTWQALVSEGLFTYILVAVYLGLSGGRKPGGHPALGVGVAMAVASATYLIGPYSGAGINPAVGIGPLWVESLLGNSHLSYLWIYVAGPMAGALLAAMTISSGKKKQKKNETILS